jgi:hypothetical protein
MSLRIDFTDPVLCAEGIPSTHISLESKITSTRRRSPGECVPALACASIAVTPDGSSQLERLNISAAGLRKLARAALHMAREVEEQQRSLEVR